jgi:DTW domain-containing protein YfiP
MHMPLCLCAELPRIETRARVILVPHALEWERPSNTGRVAALTLTGCEVITWRHDLVIDAEAPLVLYPGGELITPSDRPLIVPDGTWRQTSRMTKRLLRIPGAEAVRVDATPAANLRRAPELDRIGTGHAIVEALAALGEIDAADQLRAVLRVMVDRTLWQRGKLAAPLVTGGLPLEVRRAMSNPRGTALIKG